MYIGQAWRNCMATLSQLSIGGKGNYGIGASAVPFNDDLYRYLRITDIKDDGTLSDSDAKSVDEENASDYLLQPNDIVFARTGASVGRNYFYDGEDGPLVYAGFLIKYSIDPSKVNPKYVKYYCLSDAYKGWVSGHSSGSTRGNINEKTFGALEIPLIDRDLQDKAVQILESISRKIRTNDQINKNLQAQAIEIYRDMFMDNIDENWVAGKLSDIAQITMGQSPKGDTYNELGKGSVFYQGRAEFGNRFPTRRLYTTDPKRMAEENDVLMSVRAPVGDINVAYEKCCIGRGLGAIHSLNGHQSFVLYTMFSLRPVVNRYNGEGTVFGSINAKALNEIEVSIPDAEAMDKFEAVVEPIDAQIRKNYQENCRLQDIRDSLLPRLMSGELDVSNVEI